jgi:hypothetical protein
MPQDRFPVFLTRRREIGVEPLVNVRYQFLQLVIHRAMT